MIHASVLLFVLSGCTEHVELRRRADAALDDGGDARACRAESAACGAGAECCSGRCLDGSCARASCGFAGETCGAAADCCSFLCSGGFCLASPGCAVASEGCSASGDCCSRACASDQRGRVVCHSLGGCRPAGEICRSDADCCDAASGAGACAIFDPAEGVGRCRAPASCAQPGELCGGTGGGGWPQCCPGGAPGEMLCRPTEIAGIERCVSEQARSACLPDAARCTAAVECCSGHCAPDRAGALACQAGCAAEATSCSRSADCCAGACIDGACRSTGEVCAPFGAPCTSSAACCSHSCQAGTCSSPLI